MVERLASSIGGSKSASSVGVAYAVQTAGNGGSSLLISSPARLTAMTWIVASSLIIG
jgi:hypothetical protein